MSCIWQNVSPKKQNMAAVSGGGEKTSVDYDLQKHLKGLNTATPDLSTLAQKGDEKVRRKKQTRSYNEYI